MTPNRKLLCAGPTRSGGLRRSVGGLRPNRNTEKCRTAAPEAEPLRGVPGFRKAAGGGPRAVRWARRGRARGGARRRSERGRGCLCSPFQPAGSSAGGGTWPRREARCSHPKPGCLPELGGCLGPARPRPSGRSCGYDRVASSWAGICFKVFFMEAMSPQQETLGGQPGRSSSLTGMSRIAGGPGTKKVRTLRGAPRLPPLRCQGGSSIPAYRARPPRRPLGRGGRTPWGFNARGSRPRRVSSRTFPP